jgi:hypothetical protein
MLQQKLELEPGEEISQIIRSHWFVIVSQLTGVIMIAIIPIFLLTVLLNLPSTLNVFALPFEKYPAHITFFITVWLLFSTMSGFMVWTMYNFNLWIVTNRRLITIKQNGFFRRQVGAFRLERLQDVEYQINGLVQTFFDFGTVSAQTAGESEAEFRSGGLPHPEAIQSLIQHAVDVRLHEVEVEPGVHVQPDRRSGLA